MAKPKKAAAKPAIVEEIPTAGGSYIRHPDGSLERVESTSHDAEDAPADPAAGGEQPPVTTPVTEPGTGDDDGSGEADTSGGSGDADSTEA